MSGQADRRRFGDVHVAGHGGNRVLSSFAQRGLDCEEVVPGADTLAARLVPDDEPTGPNPRLITQPQTAHPPSVARHRVFDADDCDVARF
jgi:hypothetical protein